MLTTQSLKVESYIIPFPLFSELACCAFVITLDLIIHSSSVLYSCLKHWIIKFWAIVPGVNTGLGHNIFVKWSVPNLVLQCFMYFIICVLPFKDTLFIICIADSLTLTIVTYAWRKHVLHACFLHTAHHSLLALRNTRPHFSTVLGGILNSKITPPPRKAQKCENMALNRLKRTLVYTMRTETRGQSVALFSLSWEHACWGLIFSLFYTCLRMILKASRVLILGLQTNFSE